MNVRVSQMVQLRVSEQLAAHSDEGSARTPWPRGLLSGDGQAPTPLAPALVAELMYEVGWQSRHRMVDVRRAEDFNSVRPHGAHNVPLEPIDSFVTRAVNELRLDPDARLVISDEFNHGDAQKAARALLAAGYANTIVLEGGVTRWTAEDLPCEEDLHIEDSTF